MLSARWWKLSAKVRTLDKTETFTPSPWFAVSALRHYDPWGKKCHTAVESDVLQCRLGC
jgi:hypothetical protein